MNYFQSIVIGFFIAGSISGCSSQIDDRQTEVNQGLVYKHGDSEPYTGTVIHSKMSIAGSFDVGDCSIEYRKGLVEGETLCNAANGKKILEWHTADEKRTGIEEHWNSQNGELVYEAHWNDGKKDGVEKSYDNAGKTLLQEIHWSNGNKDGQQRVWDATGKLLTDLEWKDSKQTGVYREVDGDSTAEQHFKDGLLDGLVRISNADGPLEETPLSMGVLTGTQTFYSFGEPDIVRQWQNGSLVSESAHRHASKDVIYETDDLTCNPACPGETAQNHSYPQGFNPANAVNHQIEWPKRESGKSAASSIYVDSIDELTNQSGYGALDLLNVEKPEPRVLNLDQSQIDKVKTTFKGGRPDGIMRAWNAQGAVILQVDWENGKAITATGSLVSGDPDANATTGSEQIPGSGNACLDDWEAAYYKERGEDAVIAADQIDEWTEECKQGKTAPRS